MQPRFYADVHVSREAANQLRRKGVDITQGIEVGLADADDTTHLIYATERGLALISCDADFLVLHQEWQTQNHQHGGIIYFRMPDQCKSISLLVKEILFLHETADYELDLYNQVWRVQS